MAASWKKKEEGSRQLYAVDCDANGNVVEMDLGGRGLSGVFPFDQLAALPMLKVINLANDGPLSQTIARGAALLQPMSL